MGLGLGLVPRLVAAQELVVRPERDERPGATQLARVLGRRLERDGAEHALPQRGRVPRVLGRRHLQRLAPRFAELVLLAEERGDLLVLDEVRGGALVLPEEVYVAAELHHPSGRQEPLTRRICGNPLTELTRCFGK